MMISLLFGFSKAQIPISDCTTITSPGTYVLTNDISSVLSPCINIASNDIELDCRGFEISQPYFAYSIGVYSDSHQNITIKNCKVRGWGLYGIRIDNSLNVRVINTTFTGNNIGMGYINTYSSLVLDSVFENNGDGILFDNYDVNLISYGSNGSHIVRNSRFVGNSRGVYNYWSYNNTIINSTFDENWVGVYINGGNMTILSSTFRLNSNYHIIGGGTDFSTVSNSYFEGSPSSSAIQFDSRNNITIKDSFLLGYGSSKGIVLGISVMHGEISNVTIKNFSIGIGMWAGYGVIANDYNIIKNSKIINNNYGINIPSGLFFGCPGYNTFYNNLFNNTIENILVGGEVYCPNYFNTTKQPGPNIVGGPFIGGNYWGKTDRTGYSDVCSDSNGDGFCDEPFTIYSPFGYIDYLPLSLNFTIPEMKVTTRVFYVNKDFKEVSLCVGDKSKPMTIFACSISNWIYENLVTTTVIFIFAFLIIYFFRRLI